eukprot:jgi/Psemu1/289839/fgenesh1_pg.411_\
MRALRVRSRASFSSLVTEQTTTTTTTQMVRLRRNTSSSALIRRTIVAGVLFLVLATATLCRAETGDCDSNSINDATCLVDRSEIGPIRVVVHGTKNDPFWQQIRAGMEQIAKDVQIDLDFVLYDDDDPALDVSTLAETMARDIREVGSTGQRQRQRAMAGIVQGRNTNGNARDSGLRCGFGGCQEPEPDETESSRMDDGSGSDGGSSFRSPAAMIVSLPGDPAIEDALASLADSSNIPIFGINALYDSSSSSSEGDGDAAVVSPLLKGTVSMNETEAGIMAGTRIRDLLLSGDYEHSQMTTAKTTTTGLYINHRSDVRALTERFEAMVTATSGVVESWEVMYLEKDTTAEEVFAHFVGCKHTVVQLAGGSGIAESIMEAMVANGCHIETDHIVGTFDASTPFVYDALAEGTIDFAVAQQPYLQGSQIVLMAALYATTGQRLPVESKRKSASASGANLWTGPVLITGDSEHFPPREHRVCESEGYPVCGSDSNGSNGECPCTDRSRISIAVLTHDDDDGHDGEPSAFWTTVVSGINQAAADFGVSIEKNRFKRAVLNQRRQRQNGNGNLRLKHTFDIGEACQSPTTSGLIVSLPDASMKDSLLGCRSRGIPFLAINADANADAESWEAGSGLRYVGQKDFESGLEAGRRLIGAGVAKGWCLVHADFDMLNERCNGMKAAFAEHEHDSFEFMGIVHVPNNGDQQLYKTAVERALGSAETETDWNGYGVLSTGHDQIPALLALLDDHPELLAGTFDVDAALYQEGDASNDLRDQIVFGIDQNAYMEGYLSVAAMVWKITTSETPTSPILETGPNFLSQSEDESSNNDKKNEQRLHQCRDKGIRFCRSKPNEEFPPPSSIEEEQQQEPPLAYTGKCKNLDRKCNVCEGDCDDDTQCGDGLVCFVRDSLTSGVSDPVPGCSGNPIEWSAKDFCVDARLYECKDVDSFDVKVGNFSVKRNCGYVAVDKRRCTEYGRLCRETCGYCRSAPHTEDTTSY